MIEYQHAARARRMLIWQKLAGDIDIGNRCSDNGEKLRQNDWQHSLKTRNKRCRHYELIRQRRRKRRDYSLHQEFWNGLMEPRAATCFIHSRPAAPRARSPTASAFRFFPDKESSGKCAAVHSQLSANRDCSSSATSVCGAALLHSCCICALRTIQFHGCSAGNADPGG